MTVTVHGMEWNKKRTKDEAWFTWLNDEWRYIEVERLAEADGWYWRISSERNSSLVEAQGFAQQCTRDEVMAIAIAALVTL